MRVVVFQHFVDDINSMFSNNIFFPCFFLWVSFCMFPVGFGILLKVLLFFCGDVLCFLLFTVFGVGSLCWVS